MAGRCVKCGNKARDGLRSPLGELVCERHHTEINGSVMGGLAAGLPGAVVGPGFLRWIRGSLRPRTKVRDARPAPAEEPDTTA